MESSNEQKYKEFLEQREKQFQKFFPVIEVTTEDYKSGLDDNDQFLVEAFLFLLKEKNIIYKNAFDDDQHSFLEILYSLIDKSGSSVISNLFFDHIESICKRGRRLYWNSIGRKYANLNLDVYSDEEVKLFFDDHILRYKISENYINNDAIQPKELTAVLNYFLKVEQTLDYYNPFAGLGSLAIDLPNNINYYGEEIDKTISLLAQIRMLIYECPSNFSIVNKNSIESWASTKNIKYDYICFNPPFNLRVDPSYIGLLDNKVFGDHRNANSLIISECFKKLRDGGRMVFLIPNGFLYSNNSKEKALKKYLIDNNFVQTIVAFPERILEFTSIAINLVVLSKESNRSSEITFVDASNCLIDDDSRNLKIDLVGIMQLLNSKEDNEFKQKISVSEVATNDYSLLVNRYVFEKPVFDLEDREQIIEFKDLIISILRDKANVKKGRYVRIRDLSSNSIDFKKSFEGLDIEELKSVNSYKLKPNVLLLATTWKDLKPTLYDGKDDDLYYAYSDILAVELNDKLVNPEYLVLELQKDYVQKQLDHLRYGVTVKRISYKDLLSIDIVVPSLEEQQEKIFSYKSGILKNTQAKVEALAQSYNIDIADENSFLRHQIAGRLRNARGAFKSIKTILNQKVVDQMPDLFSFKLSETINFNLGDYIAMLERDLNSINQSVNISGDGIDLSNLNVERIGLIRFINKYVEEIKSRTTNIFKIEIDLDKNALIEHQVKEIYINGDKELLRRLFDNIIDNAEKHGFQKTISHFNKIEVAFLYDFENMEVQIDFTNTGHPMPETYTLEGFTRKGSKTGQFAGDGYGGWLMNEIMKKHGGKFDITDETGPEGIGGGWATAIELYFPIEINK